MLITTRSVRRINDYFEQTAIKCHYLGVTGLIRAINHELLDLLEVPQDLREQDRRERQLRRETRVALIEDEEALERDQLDWEMGGSGYDSF